MWVITIDDSDAGDFRHSERYHYKHWAKPGPHAKCGSKRMDDLGMASRVEHE